MKSSLFIAIIMMEALLTVDVQAAIVTLTGTYPESVIGTEEPYAYPTFSFVFQTSLNPVPPAIVESPSAFIISVTATYTNNDTSRLLEGTAGYFNYGVGFSGVDVRLQNWIGSNWVQIIFSSPYSLYSGESADPTLLVTATNGPMDFCLNGNAGSEGDEFWVPASHYSLIPEPATLLLLGLGGLFLRRKRK